MGDDAAVLPYRKRSTAAVVLARHPHLDSVDDDGTPLATDRLSWKCEHTLDELQTARQIAAFGKECGKRLRRHRNDEVSDRKFPGGPHTIEANRNALGCIPYQAGRRFRTHRGDHDRCGATHADECQEAEAHRAIPRRRSQAWCRVYV